MSTSDNPISHHTSHTMGNGASSSNSGDNCNGANSVGHHTSHTMGNGASSSETGARRGAEAANDNESIHNALEAPLTTPPDGRQNLNNPDTLCESLESDEDSTVGVPTPCSSADSVSNENDHPGPGALPCTLPSHISGNLANFSLIDTTLREGEQFATAQFSTAEKIEIAKALDAVGVEYLELTSPIVSPRSKTDCEAICKLGLKAKILCHIRCHMDDARLAVEIGVDGVNLFMGTSTRLMQHSHGKDLDWIAGKAGEVINYLKSHNVAIRFSGEDSFRSNFDDILQLYSKVHKLGATRVGIADTVGCATPIEVFEKVSIIRNTLGCEVETHFHNDTGCAIANAYTALEAGATHIDVTVLGIGERNGITPLQGFLKSLMPVSREYILKKYNVEKLAYLDNLVAQIVGVDIPYNSLTIPVEA